jgi:uncharacterized protein
MIRDLTTADRAAVLEINDSHVPALTALDTETFDFLLAKSVLALAVIGEASQVIGFCFVLEARTSYDSVNHRWFVDRYRDFAYLDRVAFAKSVCRQGLGTELYTEVERRLALIPTTPSVLALEVNLRPRNEGSLAFHERLGFVEVGQLETNYGNLVSLRIKTLASQ